MHEITYFFLFQYVCDDSITLMTIYSGLALGFFFAIINLLASQLASWRRLVLICCYLVAALSCILVGLLTEPVATMIFFILIQITAIGIGSVSSYFVDLYPTSNRFVYSFCNRFYILQVDQRVDLFKHSCTAIIINFLGTKSN